MTDRVTKNQVIALAKRVTQLATERGLVERDVDIRIAEASPSNGIQWRLTGVEKPNGGLIALDFLPDGGHLGTSAREAHMRLTYTAAALKAFPQTVRGVEQ